MGACLRISVLFLLLVSSSAFGYDYRVAGVAGHVTVKREGQKSRNVIEKEVLKTGDVIRTGRDSTLTLVTETGHRTTPS